MNSRKTLSATAILLTALFAAPTGLNAQTAQRSGYDSLNPGNEWMGGSVFAGASLYANRALRDGISFRTNDTAAATMSMHASVRFLQRAPVQLAYGLISANSRNYGTIPHDGRFQLYVRGLTERSQRFTTAGTHSFLSFYRTFDLFPTDPTVSISVSGVPVTVRGNVGVGVAASGSLSLTGPGRAGFGGQGQVWGYGRVSAQAGWSWFGAGVNLNATFANTRLNPSVAADARNPLFSGGPAAPTVSGRVAMTIQAITLKLDVWVAFVYRYTRNLVNWSSAQRSLFYIMF
jgi:hypothetical protein